MKNKVKYIELLKDMPQGLTDLEKARWLYIKLGKKISYDMMAFYLKGNLLAEKYNLQTDIHSLEDTTLTCKPMSNVYIDLLNELGIKAELVQLGDSFEYNHVATKIMFEDGLVILADLTFDLHKIQTGMRTLNFAYTAPGNEYDMLTKKELKDIDDKIGYTYKGIYLDDFVDFVSEELKNTDKVERYLLQGRKISECSMTEIISKKLDFLLEHVLPSDLGYAESRNILIDIFEKSLTNQEFYCVKQYDLVKSGEDGNLEFTNCIKISENERTVYYAKLPDKKMRRYTSFEIENLFKNGWKNKKKKEIVEEDKNCTR